MSDTPKAHLHRLDKQGNEALDLKQNLSIGHTIQRLRCQLYRSTAHRLPELFNLEATFMSVRERRNKGQNGIPYVGRRT